MPDADDYIHLPDGQWLLKESARNGTVSRNQGCSVK